MSGAVNVGRLVVSVSGDVDQLKVDMREAQAIAGAATKEIVNGLHGVTDATYDRNNAGKRMIAAMREEIATFGMGADELKVYKASLLGVGAEAQLLVDRTNAMKAAQASFTQEAAATTSVLRSHGAEAKEARGHVEGFSLATAGAKRELLVLAHELSQGNYKKFGGSMMVLGEQTGAAGLLFSAAGIAAIAMGASIIGAAVAIAKGATEQREMNNALILTGNYAGQTSDSLNNLAHAAVASGGSIGEAKKAVTQLAASGKFTGEQLGSITSAVVGLEHATGASIEETIKQFESLAVQAQGHSARASTAISQATIKLDEQYHFLTLSVYNQITAMEKEGDLKAASKIATDEFARTTKERAEEMVANLGWLSRGWNGVKEAIGGAADALGNMGKKSTAASDLKLAQLMLTQFDNEAKRDGYDQKVIDANRPQLLNKIAEAQGALNLVNGEASAKAAESLTQSNAVQAAQRIDSMLLRAQAKDQGALTTALKEYHESLDRLRAGNTEEEVDPRLTESAIKAGEAAITRMHTQAKATSDQISDYHRLMKTLNEKLAVESLAAFASDKLTFAEQERAKVLADLAGGVTKMSSTERDSALAKLDVIDTLEKAKRGADEYAKMMATVTAQDEKDIAAAEKEAAANEELAANWGKTKDQIAATTLARLEEQYAQRSSNALTLDEINKLEKLIAAKKRSAAATAVVQGHVDDQNGAAAADAASKKLADQTIRDWQRVGASISDSLSSAFGTAGKALGGMLKSYADSQAAQLRAQKELAEAKTKLDSDPNKIKEIDRINQQSAEAQMKSYADIASAAQGFFDKGSRGYKVLGAASQVMHAAELAMNLASIAPAMAAGAAQFFAESGWGGFAGVAAMAAVVAGFGVAMSGGGGGSGKSAADVQKTQSTGTVLGDLAAKSKSLDHSMSIIAENSGIALDYTLGMLGALRNIESSMSKLSAVLARTGNLDGATGAIQKIVDSYGIWGAAAAAVISKNTVDAGIQLDKTTVGGASRDGINGQRYSTLTSGRALNDPLDKSAQVQFGKVVADMAASVKEAGNLLGVQADNIESFVVDLGKISFKGLNVEERQAELEAAFSTLGDKLAKSLMGGLDDFAKAGEGSLETLTRVATDYANLNSILKSIGMDFGAVGINSIKAREDFIGLAGGIGKLTGMSKSFSDNFLTEAEQLAPVSKYVADEMGKLGLAGVTTRDQFKAVVLGLDLTSAAGQAEYVTLMNLSDAFAKTHAATADLKSAWASVTDSIVAEVRRIRGLLGDGVGQSLAGAQLQFSIATAQARAGDQDAAKLLPGLSQSMLTLAESNASTALDLRRIQAMTAASLSVTAETIAGNSGNPIQSFGASADFTQSGTSPQDYQGGIIAPAKYNQGDSSIAGLLAEMQTMRQEMSQMRIESRAQQTAIAQNTEKTAKVLVRNDTGAGILTTTTVPA